MVLTRHVFDATNGGKESSICGLVRGSSFFFFDFVMLVSLRFLFTQMKMEWENKMKEKE